MVHSQRKRLESRFHEVGEDHVRIAASLKYGLAVAPTETVVIDGATKATIKWLRDKFGMQQVEEGRRGKVLLLSPKAAMLALHRPLRLQKPPMSAAMSALHTLTLSAS